MQGKTWIVFLVLILIIAGVLLYYVYLLTSNHSLELYQELHFADDFEGVKKHILDEYEGNFTEEDFDYIQDNIADGLGQFTLFEYNEKSYVIMALPGTERLNVLAFEELPEDIRGLFLEFSR